MKLNYRKKTRLDRIMRSNTFKGKEMTEISREEADEKFLVHGNKKGRISNEIKECKDQERLKM